MSLTISGKESKMQMQFAPGLVRNSNGEVYLNHVPLSTDIAIHIFAKWPKDKNLGEYTKSAGMVLTMDDAEELVRILNKAIAANKAEV
jgi:hypothetical protein